MMRKPEYVFLKKRLEQGEGALNLFFEIFPEGQTNEQIQNIINKDQKPE